MPTQAHLCPPARPPWKHLYEKQHLPSSISRTRRRSHSYCDTHLRLEPGSFSSFRALCRLCLSTLMPEPQSDTWPGQLCRLLATCFFVLSWSTKNSLRDCVSLTHTHPFAGKTLNVQQLEKCIAATQLLSALCPLPRFLPRQRKIHLLVTAIPLVFAFFSKLTWYLLFTLHLRCSPNHFNAFQDKCSSTVLLASSESNQHDVR